MEAPALAFGAANDTAAANAPLACSQQELVPRRAGWGELGPSVSDSLEQQQHSPKVGWTRVLRKSLVGSKA